MKILVISNLYPPAVLGGYELCCRQAAEGLTSRGHEVLVLTSAWKATFADDNPNIWRQFKFANCLTAPRDAYAPRDWQQLEAEAHFVSAHNVGIMTSALARFRPDVVYLWNLIGLGGLGLLGCLKHLRVPWVWNLGDSVPRTLCSRDEQPVPEIVREFNRYVQGCYMPVSRRLVAEIEAAGVELRNEVLVTPNWVSGDMPPSRNLFYEPGQTLRIVHVGQRSPKGTALLMVAAARLRARGVENFSIDLFGRLNHPMFATRVREIGLQNHVRIHGEVEQRSLLALYAEHRFDVFAFPTWPREPFGCAPLEAAAYGTVMAISRNCGIAEWFVDGVHCLKVERSAAAFAGVLEDIIRGRIVLEPLARRAAAVIWRDFSFPSVVARIEAALSRAAAQPRDGAGSFDDVQRMAIAAERMVEKFLDAEAA